MTYPHSENDETQDTIYGGLYENERDRGPAFRGWVKCDGQYKRIVVWPNNRKSEPKDPDYRIAEDHYDPEHSQGQRERNDGYRKKMAGQRDDERGPETQRDDIPF